MWQVMNRESANAVIRSLDLERPRLSFPVIALSSRSRDHVPTFHFGKRWRPASRAIALDMALQVEWDPEKATQNLAKHAVSFEEAATVLADPLSITLPDPDHSEDEERFLLLGESQSSRYLIVA